jgi:hypothetical protein
MRPISKVENGTIHCTVGGTTFTIHELKIADLQALQSTRKDPFLVPLLQLYRGETQEAKSAFQKLVKTPPDPNVTRCLQQIQWLEAIGREDEAEELLAKARALFDRKDWKNAHDLIERLRDKYADTAFVEKRLIHINTLAESCARSLAAVRREAETIRPFIDVSENCGDLAKALKELRPSGGWVMDIDNDGRLDIALDLRNAGPRIPIFLNRTKDGSNKIVFRDATKAAGLATGDEPICWVDLDGDGDLDVVCRGLFGEGDTLRAHDRKKLAIYENRGTGASPMFRLLPARALTATLGQAPGFGGFGFGNIAVLDANGDGRSDILAQFVSGTRTLCLFLAVARKPFVFEDASRRAGFVVRKGGKLSTPAHLQVKAWPNYVIFDGDGDHRTDFIFNTDGGMLFHNRAGRTFTYVADSTVKYQTYASGATGNNPRIVPAVADYDNDGNIDILVPQNGKNLLLRNEGGGRFADAMPSTGPMATDAADSLWATWADVNNDGLLDLFVCNAGADNCLYIQKTNHAFANKAEHYGVAGKPSDATNFMAFGDFDRDGDMDMLILRAKGRNQLLLNPHIKDNNHHSLSVILRTRLGAIGAKIYLLKPDRQLAGLQQVCRVEGYNRQTPREAFFGVPAPGEYRVRVVLSSRRKIERKVLINPTRPNILIIGK